MKGSEIANELTEGYRTLFKSGITEIDKCIRLTGAPLTAGFWKSFVEVERGKRWIWDDGSFADNLCLPIMYALLRASSALGHIKLSQARDTVIALQALRAEKVPADFDEGMNEMIVSALIARDEKATHVADVAFQIDSPAGKQNFHSRFFEKPGQELRQEQFQEWIENHRALLTGNDISIVITAFNRWELPSSIELHRLGRISGYLIPDVFGPTELEQAITLFNNNDVQECMAIFSKMLIDKEEVHIRNNLAFCQLVMGDVATGLENATKAFAMDYDPLFELNKGIGEFLLNNIDTAKMSLRSALQQLLAKEGKFSKEAYYVLVIESAEKKAIAHKELPVDAAILINLFRMGEFDKPELEKELIKLYPDKAKNWLANFASHKC